MTKWNEKNKMDETSKIEYCENLSNEINIPNIEKKKIKNACITFSDKFDKIPSKNELETYIKENDPIVEGESFINKAIVDTNVFGRVKFMKRLREYVSGLGRKGRIYFTSPVLAELQDLGFIDPIVSGVDTKGRKLGFFGIWKQIQSAMRNDPKSIISAKRDIAGRINTVFGNKVLTPDNLKFVDTPRSVLYPLAEKLAKEGWGSDADEVIDEAFANADLSIIRATEVLDAPLILTLDKKHFITLRPMWLALTGKDIKIISRDYLGDKER